MVQVAERTVAGPATALTSSPPLRSRLLTLSADHGHVLLAIIGSIAFMMITPPVADLQAADARAAAAARHVGLGYWLSWFGGSTPGQYSILTPLLSSVVGVTTIAAISAIAISSLVRPLLLHTARPRMASFLAVASAMSNLWSGRVPFSVGMAVSLLGLLLLLRGRPVAGGVVNGLATLFSPLAPFFVLLLLLGPAISRRRWRPNAIRFGIPSLVGLALPAVFFGAPAPMPFGWTTLAWAVGIALAALLLDLPKDLKLGLSLAVACCLALFVVPSGVGSNVSRYCYLLLPPIVWAVARNPRRIVAVALVPAFVYSGFQVVHDLAEAAKPAAQRTYYTGLRAELATLTNRDNHRVEVLDTATHRASAELVPDVYLARGWETQSDSSNNEIFYNQALLNEVSYRLWLDDNAVAWVALPNAPGAGYQSEAALVKTGLPYLTPFWQDDQWTLYSVTNPESIIPAPARLVQSSETQFVFDVPEPATLTLRLRPTRHLRITGTDGIDPTVCMSAGDDSNTIQATFRSAGRYTVAASALAFTTSVNKNGC